MLNKSYWDNKEIIKVSDEEKKEKLNYEIMMLRNTFKSLKNDWNKLLPFNKNLLVESLATHIRVLIDFFYYNDPIINNKRKNKNDIFCEEFISNWENIKPELTQILYDAKNKADKQLAHLSRWRIKLEKDDKKGWLDKNIENDIEKVIKKFEEEYRLHKLNEEKKIINN